MNRQYILGALVVVFAVLPATKAAYQIVVRGIYDENLAPHDPKVVGFRRGILRYNVRSNETDDALNAQFLLLGIEDRVQINNSYHLTSAICEAFEDGQMLITGDGHPSTIHNAAYASTAVQIPYFVTGLAPHDLYPDFSSSYLLSLQPQILEPLVDYITYFRWDELAFLYEGEEGFLRLTTFRDMIRPLGAKIIHRRIDTVQSVNETLNEMKTVGYHRLVCDAGLQITRTVLKLALELEMVTASYHMIFLNLDLDTIDTADMSFGGMNITGFALITNKSSDAYRDLFGDWSNKFRDSHSLLAEAEVGYEAILAYDLCNVVIQAARRMRENGEMVWQQQGSQARRRTCFPSDQSRFYSSAIGPKFLTYIKSTAVNILSGRIQFDEKGARTNYSLQILGLQGGRIEQVGTWSQKETPKISFFDSGTHGRLKSADFTNRTFVVTSILEDPFLMLKENADELKGNDRYEGYCVDLLKHIVTKFPFKFRIELVKDKQYGTIQKNGKWNGMIGELMYGSADIAVAPLTINTDRERVVAFTKPYMSFGISIMVKKPREEKPSSFSFFHPLSYEIWICLALATCGVSIIMFQVCRFSTTEWRIDTDNGAEEKPTTSQIPGASRGAKWTNDFGIVNSCWFALGALMQQGSDILPRSVSGRIMGAIWWFFTLIIISSYTANLAAFLTTQSMKTVIKSAEDLAAQTKIQYGVHGSGSTMDFFKNSNVPLYRKMWHFMKNTEPSPLAKDTEDGVRRVRESDGKYAYLLESKMNEYVSTRAPCDTMAVGDPLGTSSYGIGVSKHLVDLKKQLTVAILKLREEEVLSDLEDEYWEGRTQCPIISLDTERTRALNLEKLAGVFYILLGGTAVAVLVSIVELMYRSKSLSCGFLHTFGCRRLCRNMRAVLAHERLMASLRRLSTPGRKSASDVASETTEEVSTPATTQKSLLPSIDSDEGHVNTALCKKKSGSQASAVTHTDV
ncbi:glutamate receptor 2-like [Diadema antillarum]|uniref:glutamate receptor 2-like n=1 Tax=Diadema antillarum TaxID=105358 RepID=UPI003A86AA3A